MLKNPFDVALYHLLLWELKPKTVIEIGTRFGGSALFFSDLLRTFGIEPTIHSIDVAPEVAIDIPGVTFHVGDGRALSRTLPDAMMQTLPRPLLIVEDADHSSETTLAVLRFFDAWLSAGDYIVVEDGIIDDLFEADRLATFHGGPRAGIAEFLRDSGARYEIDRRLCDFFGSNATWNVDGYLRRL